MAYVYAACVTIFSTGGKFRPVLTFMELHALTLAARSYALLTQLKIEGKTHTHAIPQYNSELIPR